MIICINCTYATVTESARVDADWPASVADAHAAAYHAQTTQPYTPPSHSYVYLGIFITRKSACMNSQCEFGKFLKWICWKYCRCLLCLWLDFWMLVSFRKAYEYKVGKTKTGARGLLFQPLFFFVIFIFILQLRYLYRVWRRCNLRLACSKLRLSCLRYSRHLGCAQKTAYH